MKKRLRDASTFFLVAACSLVSKGHPLTEGCLFVSSIPCHVHAAGRVFVLVLDPGDYAPMASILMSWPKEQVVNILILRFFSKKGCDPSHFKQQYLKACFFPPLC